jgi:hypothetical protein
MTTKNTSAHAIALETVERVLGPIRARMLLGSFLARREQGQIETVDDLHAFGVELGTYGGTEESVGARICRQAAQMGAGNDQTDE